MWPKYPKFARRTPRFEKTRAICRTSNFAGRVANGPSPTKNSTTRPPATASAETKRTFARQSALPTAFTRYGEAFPSVSAPTRTPSAVPRPRLNHVAMSFMPGGYTPARHTPTRKRKATPKPKPCANSPKAALTIAHAIAERVKRRRELMMSGRLRSAERSQPATKPNSTARVSQLVADSDSRHSARMAGATAEAENHRDIPRSSAAPKSASARQRPAPSAASTFSATALSKVFSLFVTSQPLTCQPLRPLRLLSALCGQDRLTQPQRRKGDAKHTKGFPLNPRRGLFTVAVREFVYHHPGRRAPDDVRRDHQRVAARRVLGRRADDPRGRQPAQIAPRPPRHAEAHARQRRRRAESFEAFAQSSVERAARRAVGEVRGPRRRLALLLVEVFVHARLLGHPLRHPPRRQRVLLVLWQRLVHQLHRERHRRGGGQARERAEQDSVHSRFCPSIRLCPGPCGPIIPRRALFCPHLWERAGSIHT